MTCEYCHKPYVERHVGCDGFYVISVCECWAPVIHGAWVFLLMQEWLQRQRPSYPAWKMGRCWDQRAMVVMA